MTGGPMLFRRASRAAGFVAVVLAGLLSSARAHSLTTLPSTVRNVDPRVCGVNGSFHAIADMNQPRAFSAAALLDDGRVLVAGSDTFSTSAQLFDPVTEAWQAAGSLSAGRCYGCGTAKLLDGRVLVAGGWA